MKYKTYLKNKNLSSNTIKAYWSNIERWLKFLNGKPATKAKLTTFINEYNKDHSPNSVKLAFSAIMSYLKYQKYDKLISAAHDIRLPSQVSINKNIIDIKEYESIKNNFKNERNWYKKRNWLIFSILFTTGIRVSELNQISKSAIIDKTIMIKGKGNKNRPVFLGNYLTTLINNWRSNQIIISKNHKKLTYKQINLIIKQISQEHFYKKLSPHDLRRSFATNLSRNGVDLKTISLLLGHSNINTTSRYIFYTQEEIRLSIDDLF